MSKYAPKFTKSLVLPLPLLLTRIVQSIWKKIFLPWPLLVKSIVARRLANLRRCISSRHQLSCHLGWFFASPRLLLSTFSIASQSLHHLVLYFVTNKRTAHTTYLVCLLHWRSKSRHQDPSNLTGDYDDMRITSI